MNLRRREERMVPPPGLARRLLHTLHGRLFVGMGVMLLPLVVLAAIAFSSLQEVTTAIDDVVQEGTEELGTVLRLQLLIQQAMIVAHDAVTQGLEDPAALERVRQANQGVQAAFTNLGAGPFALPEERALIRSALEHWLQGQRIGEALFAKPSTAEGQPLAKALERAHTHHNRAIELLDQVHTLAQQEINGQLASALAVRQRAFLGITSLFVIGLGIAVTVGTVLARSVVKPLRALEQGADRFGTGDLSHRVPLAGPDEVVELARTFNTMADKLAQSQSLLRELATRDGLTGLINHRELHRQLREEVERFRRYARPFSLLMLDIDHFKKINDSFGHLAGDKTLRALAALVRREVRPTDLVARYGGEEFALVLPETSGPGAQRLAERLRERIASHAIPVAADKMLRITVSIGVAVYPEDADSTQRLLGAADRALYLAKTEGRDRVRRCAAA